MYQENVVLCGASASRKKMPYMGRWRLQNSSLPVREDSDADGLCRRGIRL